jgi:D-apionolactonase
VTEAIPAGIFSAADRVSLRAGPLTLEFDRGTLRWIRCGSREVLRGIYVAVRDPQWTTVPGTLAALAVESGPDRFRARFRSSHREGPIHFDWEGVLEGDAAGTVRFAMDGEARSTFLKNRVGLCVLHPLDECAGQPCEVERADGEVVRGVFPRFVSPQQPFVGIRAIRHEVVPGLVAELRFLGDVFEMEDHRNWSDASFKTYSTPLALPYPAEVRAGTRVQQSVTLRLTGEARPRPVLVSGADAVRLRVDGDRPLPRPRVGLGAASEGRALTDGERSRLRALSLDHLRVDLHLAVPGVDAELARAVQESRALDVPLEVALFLSDDAEGDLQAFASLARGQKPRVGIWLLFREATATTTDGLVAQVRRWLLPIDPQARFGGGTDLNFAELNRGRPSAAELDQVSFSLNPQVHAFDDATLLENLTTLRALADSARAFVGSCPLALSPVTLRPRSRGSQAAPTEADPRQALAFGAVWTAGLLAAATEAGFASLTLFEPAGPSGLVEGERVHPVFHVLEVWAATKGGVALPVHSESPERVQALAFRTARDIRALVFNLSPENVQVHLGGLPLGALATRIRPDGKDVAEAPAHTSEGYRLALGAYEIVCVEARA